MTDQTSIINNYIEEPWVLIHKYFEGQHLERLVRHQLESYNNFIKVQIVRTINMFNPIHILSPNPDDYDAVAKKHKFEIMISFDNFNILRPQIYENNGASKSMFPNEARLRNFTYAGMMTLNMNLKIIRRFGDHLENEEIQHKIIDKVHIGKLPIMLKSCICELAHYKHLPPRLLGECTYDTGGYFIINGSEKVVIAQERASENKIYCYRNKKAGKFSWSAEIKSVPDHKIISPKEIKIIVSNRDNGYGYPLDVVLPRLKNPIPLFVFFRALGVLTDYEITRFIVMNDIVCSKYTDKYEEVKTHYDYSTYQQHLIIHGVQKRVKINTFKNLSDKRDAQIMEFLQGSIMEAAHIQTQEEAIQAVMKEALFYPMNMSKAEGEKKKLEFTYSILEKDLFPHCKTDAERIHFLGYMTNILIQSVLGYRGEDDRDSYMNKKIDLTGTVLNNLFRNYFNKLVKDMTKQIQKEMKMPTSWRSTGNYLNIINKTNIYKMIKISTIENGIKRALATGDFAVKGSNSTKVGVAQVLSRLTYIAGLSHLRRINTPIDKSGKLIPPRKLHATSWGFICPSETPEGASIGVVKNMSIMTHITIPSHSSYIYEQITPFITPISDIHEHSVRNVRVFINGTWIGCVLPSSTLNAFQIYMEIKNMKFIGKLNIYTSVVFDIKNLEIRICNESGRMVRPLLRVKNGRLLITDKIIQEVQQGRLYWDDLFINHKITEAVMEYIDPDEQNYALVAEHPHKIYDMENPKRLTYTHSEIHASTIFGTIVSCSPFPEYNQSPRVTYQSAQAKQAMGVYTTNFDQRMDKSSYVLTYPMRPLIDTRFMNIIRLNEIPSGEVVIVAIASYSGYNQEDSIIFNKSAIDRGLFSATIYHTEKDEDRKIYGDEEMRCKPNRAITKGMKFANYDKLNERGLVEENTFVEKQDVIIGKVVPIKEHRADLSKVVKYQDYSMLCHAEEADETYIDKNYAGRNGDGYNFCKIRMRTLRKPVIGDKFSSRHAQKGTVGIVLPEADMPFTGDGLKPDIIINPHAIPSRMTIGQLKESLICWVLCELGLFGDGTSFNELSIQNIRDELLKMGYEQNGNRVMYDGHTGEQMETSIFIGPTFYQRLKHMVNDKVQSRARGAVVLLTRQSVQGRANEGGGRCGEMERDAILSHGMGAFIRDRMYFCADKYQVNICKKCGKIAAYNETKSIYRCMMCDNRTNFALVQVPYAFKLLSQELESMNIVPRLITE